MAFKIAARIESHRRIVLRRTAGKTVVSLTTTIGRRWLITAKARTTRTMIGLLLVAAMATQTVENRSFYVIRLVVPSPVKPRGIVSDLYEVGPCTTWQCVIEPPPSVR